MEEQSGRHMIGQTLAHYKILEKIGSGGMGDVYLAEDTKLDRKVALKVLPPELAESEERRARFKREAKALAALDHPNIVTVHSVEEAEGVHFITMQFVHGKTLTELLPKNGFPLNKFFDIAIPLADAVAAAHQEGITHRDLKPDNMMVGADGRVKVLDFGLAKPAGGFAVSSETPTAARTDEGVIVGTVAYMSPEQAQGKAVDPRSDIFSLGVVLYEMLTGRRPFSGENPAEILSSIIKDTPDSTSELNPAVPRDLAKLVRRCLAKDPNRRLQSAVDVRNELEETKQEVDSGEAVLTTAPSPRTAVPWTNLLLLAGAAVGIATIVWITSNFRTGAESPPRVPRLMNPVQITSAVGVEDYPTWSPDGRTLAYAGGSVGRGDTVSDIWVVQATSGQQAVDRTASFPDNDYAPTWSPDGSQIAFFSHQGSGDGIGGVGGYFLMSAVGGPAREVISSDMPVGWSAPQWSADGNELAGIVRDSFGVFVELLDLRTQESRRVELPGAFELRNGLSWSRDGRFFAYVVGVTSAQVHRLRVLRVADGHVVDITEGATDVWSPSWSNDGRALYFVSSRSGSMDLWQQPMTADGSPEGAPRAVTAGLGIRRAAFSPDGTRLAYSKGRLIANLWRVPIREAAQATWNDAEQVTFDEAFVETVDLSPDGTRFLVGSDRSGNMDLWVREVSGGNMVQVTSDAAMDVSPRWSPDGQMVAFHSSRTGNREIWVKPVDGGPSRQLTDFQPEGAHAWFPTWSPDGREIAFARLGTSPGVYAVPSAGGEPRYLTTGWVDQNQTEWSPDGKWIVKQGNPGPSLIPANGGDGAPLTEGRGSFPRWSRDGARVYFLRDENLWAVSPNVADERRMTDLVGRAGALGVYALATDGEWLYFTWQEDRGDIWVMDVVTDESE